MGLADAVAAVEAIGQTISDSNEKSRQELKELFLEMSKTPSPLLTKDESSKALEALVKSGAEKISYETLQGFNGIDEFEPSGWQAEVEYEKSNNVKQESQDETPRLYPLGTGMAIMSGCYGSNYQKFDQCYQFSRGTTRCVDQIDAANFIGVGFDGRGLYSSESRKNSLIQRICTRKRKFNGRALPDTMNAFGLYGMFIHGILLFLLICYSMCPYLFTLSQHWDNGRALEMILTGTV